MKLLSNVLVVMATLLFLLFLYAVSSPKIEPPTGTVLIGMPILVASLFVLGIAVRFVKLPKNWDQ